MKFLLRWLLLCLVAQFPLGTYGQQHPEHSAEEYDHEVVDDAYLPNAYGGTRTTPAYRDAREGAAKVTSTTIVTTQSNVGPGGVNIVGDAANEPSIAVNPLDPNYIAIGWRQFDNIASNFRQGGWSHSTDGGATWSPVGILEPGIFRSDPVLDYDLDGKFYYNSLTNTPDYYCKMFGSTNSGQSWDAGTDAHGGDKQWVAVDRTSGPGSGHLYSVWSTTFSTCMPYQFTRSVNGNVSFENCTAVDGNPWRGTMAVGGNGTVYISAMSFDDLDSVVFAKSDDAQMQGSSISWSHRFVHMDGFLELGNQVNPVGLSGQINIDVDASGGPGDGNIYIVAPLHRHSNLDQGDVMFVRSTDDGGTWSAPVKINDDGWQTNMQWFSAMSVAPNGRIDVAWLDTRDAPGTDSSALYFSYSTDQGATWSTNERLSEPFDPHVGYPNQEKLGDYYDMQSTNEGAHLAWAGTFNGEEDVYYSFIVPGVIAGLSPGSLQHVQLHPNPSQGLVTLTVQQAGAKLRLMNPLGVTVYETSLQAGPNELDLRELPAGILVARVEDGHGRWNVQRLVLTH